MICTEDPIVSEVRRARAALAQSCDYDLGRIFAAARERQERSGREVIVPIAQTDNDRLLPRR